MDLISVALGLTIFAPSNSAVSLTGESYALTNYQVRLIYESLKKHHDSAKCRISRHNALAHLTLFVCLLATGHRRSTTPFPFPWDFSPFEQLVFICDKLVTEAKHVLLHYLTRRFHTSRRIPKTYDGSLIWPGYLLQQNRTPKKRSSCCLTKRRHQLLPRAWIFSPQQACFSFLMTTVKFPETS